MYGLPMYGSDWSISVGLLFSTVQTQEGGACSKVVGVCGYSILYLVTSRRLRCQRQRERERERETRSATCHHAILSTDTVAEVRHPALRTWRRKHRRRHRTHRLQSCNVCVYRFVSNSGKHSNEPTSDYRMSQALNTRLWDSCNACVFLLI